MRAIDMCRKTPNRLAEISESFRPQSGRPWVRYEISY